MGNQKILEEKLDPGYEPTLAEVTEYAEWLGMDLELEKELLWIARQGLTAKLPPEWKPCQNEDGQLYYFNFDTGNSVWEHPCDTVSKQLYKQEKAARAVQRVNAMHEDSPSAIMAHHAPTLPYMEEANLAFDVVHDAVEEECRAEAGNDLALSSRECRGLRLSDIDLCQGSAMPVSGQQEEVANITSDCSVHSCTPPVHVLEVLHRFLPLLLCHE
eukprot:jgi/Ulvmu1/3370/UM156_0027.1